MTFLSADEDFQERTLATLPGALEKLAYLASLRSEAGEYRHWGMSRIYGDRAADAAMSQAHTRVWLDLLRTPIPELLRQLTAMKTADARVVMNEIRDYRRLACPADLSGGGVRHFNSILLALESLSPPAAATHRGA